MAFVISDRVVADKLTRQLDKSRKDASDALEKLSTGQIFTSSDPKPSDRALAEGLEFRLRSLASSKRNINDAISLLQTADSSMNEISNMLSRMREVNVAAANTTLTDRERRYLFVEYEALYDEVTRIASTTEFNGIPILNGQADNAPEELIFHIGDTFLGDEDTDELNVLRFEGFSDISATAEGLGLKSARSLLIDSEQDGGISVRDAEDLMSSDGHDQFANVYDMALTTLSTQRAVFGAMQARLQHAMDFQAVYAENIAAAKSRIADTDYATEVAKLAQSNILVQATTGLLAQNNLQAGLALNLIGSILK